MHTCSGILEYMEEHAVIWLDPELGRYYRSLVPRYYYAQPQKYPTHVTVVRLGRERIINRSSWGKYRGTMIDIQYDGVIRFDETYFYLNAYSDCIGDIRQELGLPRFRLTELGASMGCYHITVANTKP